MGLRYRPIFIVATMLFMVITGGNSYAYRPFITEDAGVTPQGKGQIETNIDCHKWRNGDRLYDLWLVPVYGFTERLEMSLEIPYFVYRQQDPAGEQRGVGDINVVAKYLLYGAMPKDGTMPQELLITAKGVIKTASGDEKKGLGSGDNNYSPGLVISRGFFNRLWIHGMAGYTWVGKDADPELKNQYYWGLALDWQATQKLNIVTELVGNRHPASGAEVQQVTAIIGLYYSFGSSHVLDITGRRGFEDGIPRWTASLGFSVYFY